MKTPKFRDTMTLSLDIERWNGRLIGNVLYLEMPVLNGDIFRPEVFDGIDRATASVVRSAATEAFNRAMMAGMLSDALEEPKGL